MTMYINDRDHCWCGAYWNSNGFCSNGHLRSIANACTEALTEAWKEQAALCEIEGSTDPNDMLILDDVEKELKKRDYDMKILEKWLFEEIAAVKAEEV